MPCRVGTEPAHGLVAVRAEGPLTVEDIFTAISQVWDAPAYQACARVLWDLRRAQVEELRGAELQDLVFLERQARPDSRRARMAILVASEVGYGMARMFEALVGGEPIDVHIVRHDEEEAWRWLKAPKPSAAADVG